MTSAEQVELDCFLEVEGAVGCQAEEVASAVAEEVEAWVEAGKAADETEAANATEVARQLRVIGWLIAVEMQGEDLGKMMEQLEELVARATEVMTPPATSGVRRKFTPPVPFSVASLYDVDEDDDMTVVRKAKWDQARSTNRILKKDGAEPASHVRETMESRPEDDLLPALPSPRRR